MLSVVIPTLQKNVEVLEKLIVSLINDSEVFEIILIDNSLKGFDRLKHHKLKVIIPKENLYVNPSWNLGVKMSVCDVVALLNDDIVICENFCKKVYSKMSPSIGIVGFNSSEYMELIDGCNFEEPVCINEIELEEIKYRDVYFGVAMFFYKTSYYEIPPEIKIVYGDDFLLYKNKLNGKKNYKINGIKILHIGSLSSANKSLKFICKQDAKIYKKLTLKWYKRIFSFENMWDCFKLRLVGLTFKISK